jgi:ATP-dependent protease HslVU (ClpYQ) ATPase subunit
MIKPNDLIYKNKLIMLSHTGNGLTGIRQQQVSDELVEIIMNLLNDKTITHNDLKKLNLSEKQMLDNLLYLSGLHKSSDNTLSQTRQAMKHRLELIEGEISAGNTNPELKKELHGLLLKMAHGGLIHYPQAYSHYRNLTKHFK